MISMRSESPTRLFPRDATQKASAANDMVIGMQTAMRSQWCDINVRRIPK